MQIVCGQFFSFLDVGHRTAGEGRVVGGEAHGVGRARMVYQGVYREDSLKVDISDLVCTNYVAIDIKKTCN